MLLDSTVSTNALELLLIPLQNPQFTFSSSHRSSTMASRCRTISRPAMSFLKSSFSKPSSTPMFSAQSPRLSPSPFSRYVQPLFSRIDMFSPSIASNGYAPISVTASLGIVVGSANLLSRHRHQGLQIFVSGYALQCQPWSLIDFIMFL
ncbi:hypothetical protein SASPL_121934 [Salvia splendens]|uniref:Uncharacterized protein n=1 Tax=Salvia splendens TaxID=180675 RepID=A0A8X8XKM5_SALSN|nr:hypothetical protein SASPL_121934 [Salvia splendens]